MQTTLLPPPFQSKPVIRFTVPGCPVAQPRQRTRIAGGPGKQFVQNYTPSKSPIADYKATVKLAAAQAIVKPLDGPLIVSLVFIFPRGGKPSWIKMVSSWFRPWKEGRRVPHIVKPDRDNLDKATLDAMSGIAFTDDKLACCGRLEKWIAAEGEPAHVEVTIEAF